MNGRPRCRRQPPTSKTLNPEQRRAVEHGAAGGLAAPPLLVIAGAGSGKTNTLAHRVAHLIVQAAEANLYSVTNRKSVGNGQRGALVCLQSNFLSKHDV